MSIDDIFKKLEMARAASGGVPEWLIVGLGNPGKEYEGSRHNVGFQAISLLEKEWHFSADRLKFHALTARIQLPLTGVKTVPVLFMRPQTFMNLSGTAVAEAASFYKIPPEKILVIYDDISLPEGTIRIRGKGSAGGHNGIKNITALLGTDTFPRVKVGVGAPPNPEWDLADWVLSAPAAEAGKKLQAALERLPAILPDIIEQGWSFAAGRHNGVYGE